MDVQPAFVALIALLAGALPVYAWSRRRHARTERELAGSRARLRAIFDSADVGIAVTTPQGDYLEANACWCKKLGYAPDEIRHLTHTGITYPEDVEVSRRQIAALTSGEIDACGMESRFLRKDGRIFWARMSITAIRDGNGRIDGLIGIVHDINERKLARLRLGRIIQSIPVPLLVADGDRVEHSNDAFHRLFGYGEEMLTSLENWRCMAYPDPGYRADVVARARRLIDAERRGDGGQRSMQVRIRCANGEDKEIELHYVDLDGVGIWTLSDISEHQALLGAMRQANEHLLEQLSEINKLQELLREQAMRDALTGLFNRRYLDDIIERELSRAIREGYPLTVAMLDIDHFKRLNDTYGHQAGDEVLKALGNMLRENARTEDIPCRYGGEEFLLVLPNMGLAHARQRADQWRERFGEMRIAFGQFTLASTLSIGVATFPEHGRTRDHLIDAADRALYLAKHNGRNRVEISAD